MHIFAHFGAAGVVAAGVCAGVGVVAAGGGGGGDVVVAGVGAVVTGAVDGAAGGVTGVAGASVAPAHSPSVAIVIFAPGFLHCATESAHAFAYVRPSEPHTGLKLAVQTFGHPVFVDAGVDAGTELPLDGGVSVAGTPAAVGARVADALAVGAAVEAGVGADVPTYDVRRRSSAVVTRCGATDPARWMMRSSAPKP